MAEAEPQHQMSLIPYSPSDSQQIVLRRPNAVVVYDRESGGLSLVPIEPNNQCPLCHQPLSDSVGTQQQYDPGEVPSSSHDDNNRYVNPDYFRLLAHSTPNSTSASASHTPRRQVPALRAARSRDVSGSIPSSGPPTGAEFVSSSPSPESAYQSIQHNSFSPGYFNKFFTVKHELGRGGNGVVFLVEQTLEGFPLGEYACKRIPVGNDRSWLGKALIEVRLLQELQHESLVHYYHVWLEETQISIGPSVPCVYILQQYCNAGDLQNYVLGSMKAATTNEALKARMRRRSKGLAERPTDFGGPRSMNLDQLFSFFHDIASGLHHLHTQGYIHRDLKPSNCLLHKDKEGAIRVHVSDFGEVQRAGEKRASTGHTGTMSYCAPEVLQQMSGSSTYQEFTTSSDVFSLGLILYFMCFGRLPYKNASVFEDEAEDIDQLRAEVTAWQGFDDSQKTRPDLPEELYRFLKRLLSPDPAERPNTDQILQLIGAGGQFLSPNNQSPGLSSMSSRIHTVETDSPANSPRPSNMQRRPSKTSRLSRGSAQMHRTTSNELIRSPRNSPPGRIHNSNNQSQTTDSAMALRSQFPPPPPETPTHQSTDSKTKQPPQLMLPPPARSSPMSFQRLRSINHLPHNELIIILSKLIIFAVKLFTLTQPCAPLATKTWLMYPLMVLSLFDFLESRRGLQGSGVLLLLHLGALALVKKWVGMCVFGG